MENVKMQHLKNKKIIETLTSVLDGLKFLGKEVLYNSICLYVTKSVCHKVILNYTRSIDPLLIHIDSCFNTSTEKNIDPGLM